MQSQGAFDEADQEKQSVRSCRAHADFTIKISEQHGDGVASLRLHG